MLAQAPVHLRIELTAVSRRATRVSSVASGRQARRTGAVGDVPSPADTSSHAAPSGAADDGAWPAPGHQRERPLARPRVEVAVRHEGAVARHADLPAVRVPRDDERGPVGGIRVEHPLVGRVRHADGQVGVGRRGAAHEVEPVVAEVRVVDTDEVDGAAAHLEGVATVGQVDPARRVKACTSSPVGSRGVDAAGLGVVLGEVPSGFLSLGAK